ncbi:MAG: HAD-IIB family hydrolase [Trueperaceae bacterium]|nr:HAD-IIB family hydrolase [Trueperaceae bacterium]
MIPLVLLDLDGTLIGEGGTVRPCVWDAAAAARNAGVRLAVCTGRPGFGIAARVARELDPGTPHIFQNGAQVIYIDGDTVQVSALRQRSTERLVRHARERGLVLELYTPDALYVERRTEISTAHAKMIGVNAIVRDLAGVAADEPVVRAQWVVGHDRIDEALEIEVDGVDAGVATSPALKDTYFVSLTRTGVSKGSAATLLCKRLEIDPAHAMAVGDSLGDASMLDAVGHPRVMGDAPAEMLARYPHHLGTTETCGAAAALEEAVRARRR